MVSEGGHGTTRLHPGQEVERYRVEAQIGEGGMAAVYRVRHTQLNSVHALKVLSAGTKMVRYRLLQEGRAQAALRHNNIVAVTDVLELDGDPALVMEFVDGPTLSQWLRDNQPRLDEAVALFKGIVKGMRHAHRKGFIHRDLKPSNVLLAYTEDGLLPKVTDFGLVKAVQGPGGRGSTRSGVAMGTPEYMAPEQIRDASSVDQRADMFALGCLFYRIVCGRPAFSGDDMLQVFNAVANGRYLQPSDLVPNLPPNVTDLINHLLAPDPEVRLADCDTLIDELDALDFSSSAVGRPLPTLELERRRSSGSTTFTPPEELDTQPIITGAPRPSRVGIWPILALPVGALVLAGIIALFAGPGGGPRTTVAGVVSVEDEKPEEVNKTTDDDEPDTEEPVASADPEPTPIDTEPPPPADPPTRPEVPPGGHIATAPKPGPTSTDPPPGTSGGNPDPEGPPEPSGTEADTDADTDTDTDTDEPPEPARVTFTGATRVWLEAEGEETPAGGAVPPGSYRVRAQFGSADPIDVGAVTLDAGQEIEVRCLQMVNRCKID